MRGVILFLMLSLSVLADGMYVAPSTYVLPEVTAQQALLVHRDGVETMVIASTLDSESQELGWIIPVPAKPTALKKANPGVLKVFDMQSGPRVHNHVDWGDVSTLMLFLITLIVWIIAFRGFRGPTKLTKKDKLVRAQCALYLSLLFFIFSTSTSARSRGIPVVLQSGVTVHDQVQVGNYQTSVIEAENPQALNVWLKTNSLAELPENAVTVAKDYIAKNWVFCCFRLTRSDAGLNTPHPVQISFPSEQLIYPMQFTALTGESGYFDLFTLTDKHVVCEDLETKVSVPLTYQGKTEYDEQPLWVNEGEGIRLGGNLMEDVAWEMPIFARFSGKLDFSSGRHADLAFTADGTFKGKTTEWTKQAFWTTWVTLLLWGCVIWLIIAFASGGRKFAGKCGVIGGFLLIFLAALYLTPLVNTQIRVFTSWGYFNAHEIAELGIDRSKFENEEVYKAALLAAIISEGLARNVYTNEPLQIEDSPGNIWIEKVDGNNYEVRIIDKTGRKWTYLVPHPRRGHVYRNPKE